MRAAILPAVALGAAMLLAHPARADNETACGAVLCLAGGGGAGCASYLAAYFSIRVYDHGFFRPDATSAARHNWLNQCSSAPQSTIASENAQYGGSEYNPKSQPKYIWDTQQ
ncbi:TrbM/KikA/MpfK family conjugal transfer protein [Acidocella facilis]|uniref:TrbM/KikA/MpfK family conjugal transfer protein n=1 Tax=Acidocella facilis TaxID=525 RepID=UPI001EEEFC07|nr:TrbM/KikA/MpfK family conjugal transfer protein [Acidocella facilis]